MRPELEKVEEAEEVLVMLPPVKVMPLEENRPPCPARAVPLEKVLVAVFVWRIEPPVERVIPLEDETPAVDTAPVKVEVELEPVTLMNPWRVEVEPGTKLMNDDPD